MENKLLFQHALSISYEEKLDEELFWIVRFMKSKRARVVVWIIKCAHSFSWSHPNYRKNVEMMVFLFFYAARFYFHLFSEAERKKVANLFYERIFVIINGYPSSPKDFFDIPSFLNLRFKSYTNIFEKVPLKECFKVLIDFQTKLFKSIEKNIFSTIIFQDYLPSKSDYQTSAEFDEFYKEVLPIFTKELEKLICGFDYSNRWDDSNYDLDNPPIEEEGEEDEGNEWERIKVDDFNIFKINPVFKQDNKNNVNSNNSTLKTTKNFSQKTINDLMILIVRKSAKFLTLENDVESRKSIFQSVEIMILLYFIFYQAYSDKISDELRRNITSSFINTLEEIIRNTRGGVRTDISELVRSRILSYIGIGEINNLKEREQSLIEFMRNLIEDIEETEEFGTRKYINNPTPYDYQPSHIDFIRGYEIVAKLQSYMANNLSDYVKSLNNLFSITKETEEKNNENDQVNSSDIIDNNDKKDTGINILGLLLALLCFGLMIFVAIVLNNI